MLYQGLHQELHSALIANSLSSPGQGLVRGGRNWYCNSQVLIWISGNSSSSFAACGPKNCRAEGVFIEGTDMLLKFFCC